MMLGNRKPLPLVRWRAGKMSASFTTEDVEQASFVSQAGLRSVRGSTDRRNQFVFDVVMASKYPPPPGFNEVALSGRGQKFKYRKNRDRRHNVGANVASQASLFTAL